MSRTKAPPIAERPSAGVVSVSFLHRAFAGGIPDEEFLSERENFRELVRLEVKGRAPKSGGEYLRAPSVAGRWLAELKSTSRAVEGQLAARASDANSGDYGRLAGPAEYGRWRSSALRFLGHVEGRISEAEAIVGGTGAGPSPAEPVYDENLLTRVRGYLVSEAEMPEAVRERKRERLIRVVSEAIEVAARASGPGTR